MNPRLNVAFLGAFLLLAVQCRLGGGESSCAALPPLINFKANNSMWTYKPHEASLNLNLDDFLFFSSDWCNETDSSSSYFPYFKLDLISTTKQMNNKYGGGRSRDFIREKCRKLKKSSYVQEEVMLHVNKTRHNFNYVQGLYYVRLSACTSKSKKTCGLEDLICSQSERLSAAVPKNDDVCEYEFPSNVSADVIDTSQRFPRFYGLGGGGGGDPGSGGGGAIGADDPSWYCDISLRAVIPLCTAHQSYDTVTVTAVDIPEGEDTCSFADYHSKDHNLTDVAVLRPCDNSTGCFENVNATSPLALLQHDIRHISRNSSYCLFFRLNNPHCRGDAGCVFYTQTLNCDLLRSAGGLGLFTGLVTQPVFIGVVSATLFLSLALLMWTVIQCSKKKPGTPLMSNSGRGGAGGHDSGDELDHPGGGLIVKKPPPRSLTEDDLEHISRLPSQEIVLVYFPDTKRFKELNRKLRDWLVTLDVNDVKDIYDEKCSEDVLRNPEAWVKSTLAGREKRIILVCSRLAYECLMCVKKGISSPKFTENDPHFGLLTRTIQFLDREMRGNYRNLICVRYEDLKICARNYSSEAFNIVPGTEYVLPQHLEDVYRWIHPRDPKPECWDEHRPEVRTLLDAIKAYRNHDENIFTVTFNEATAEAALETSGGRYEVESASSLTQPLNGSPFTTRRLLRDY